MSRARPLLVGLVAAIGCAAEPTAAPPACPAGADAVGGACVPHFDECGDAALPIAGGGCRALGVPSEACGVGTVADGHGGCAVVGPTEPCPTGRLALPGETVCREVAACGPGRWGTLPTGAPIVYVDAAYVGGGSTGAEDRPFPTLDVAVSAAPAGAVLALAAGTYTGNVTAPRAVKLHGRCPAEVALVPADPTRPVLELGAASEITSLAARGAIRIGAKVRGVVLDRVWVHDAPGDGVQLVPGASVVVRRSLVERNGGGGVLAVDADAVVEESVIRDALPGTAPASGQVLTGLGLATLVARRSLFERFGGLGIRADQAQLTLEDCVVRDATAAARRGSGVIDVNGGSSTVLKPLVVRRTIIARTRGGAALRLGLADAVLEHVTIEDARGDDGAVLANRARLSVTGSSVTGGTASGVFSYESEVSLTDVLVRDVGPTPDGGYGYGIGGFGGATRAASLRVERALVRGCRFAGVFVNGASATLTDVFVDGVAARPDGAFGDGVSVSAVGSDAGPVAGMATLLGVRVRGAARAAVSAFASQVALQRTMLQCSAFDLDGETAFVDAFGRRGEGPYGFADGGDVTCVCGATVHPCVGRESKLAPLPPPAPP